VSTDEKSAKGQNRTTKTKWSDVAPYIRFRYERTRECLPVMGTVYEMGCGIGVGLNFLAESRPDLKFVGFDNSVEALSFGRDHFASTKNMLLQHTPSLNEVAAHLKKHSFLVALEVIEHLNNDELEFFKRIILKNVDEAFFSFPYNEKNIEGTNHLQTIDIYTIFELFPGFETLFLRRGSIKFIGHWKRRVMPYLAEKLGVRGEVLAIEKIANWS
jgi:SAM-dependent methyltransferase